jgi:hypothetical protein
VKTKGKKQEKLRKVKNKISPIKTVFLNKKKTKTPDKIEDFCFYRNIFRKLSEKGRQIFHK